MIARLTLYLATTDTLLVQGCNSLYLKGLFESTGPVFTNSQEPSLFFFSQISKFEYNTTSDWLNRKVKPIRSCVAY